jgi:hypothetical protein
MKINLEKCFFFPPRNVFVVTLILGFSLKAEICNALADMPLLTLDK